MIKDPKMADSDFVDVVNCKPGGIEALMAGKLDSGNETVEHQVGVRFAGSKKRGRF
jgi:hypothetical protein